ncbi:hypothetical protein GCM10009826_06520 [Humibacillus xanthopallidus]
MKWPAAAAMLTVGVLAACSAPQEPPAEAAALAPYTIGCQPSRSMEWVPSVEPFATAERALEHAAEHADLPGLPRSGWQLLSDDNAGRRIYASGSWGVEVLRTDGGWLAVSASTCSSSS